MRAPPPARARALLALLLLAAAAAPAAARPAAPLSFPRRLRRALLQADDYAAAGGGDPAAAAAAAAVPVLQAGPDPETGCETKYHKQTATMEECTAFCAKKVEKDDGQAYTNPRLYIFFGAQCCNCRFQRTPGVVPAAAPGGVPAPFVPPVDGGGGGGGGGAGAPPDAGGGDAPIVEPPAPGVPAPVPGGGGAPAGGAPVVPFDPVLVNPVERDPAAFPPPPPAELAAAMDPANTPALKLGQNMVYAVFLAAGKDWQLPLDAVNVQAWVLALSNLTGVTWQYKGAEAAVPGALPTAPPGVPPVKGGPPPAPAAPPPPPPTPPPALVLPPAVTIDPTTGLPFAAGAAAAAAPVVTPPGDPLAAPVDPAAAAVVPPVDPAAGRRRALASARRDLLQQGDYSADYGADAGADADYIPRLQDGMGPDYVDAEPEAPAEAPGAAPAEPPAAGGAAQPEQPAAPAVVPPPVILPPPVVMPPPPPPPAPPSAAALPPGADGIWYFAEAPMTPAIELEASRALTADLDVGEPDYFVQALEIGGATAVLPGGVELRYIGRAPTGEIDLTKRVTGDIFAAATASGKAPPSSLSTTTIAIICGCVAGGAVLVAALVALGVSRRKRGGKAEKEALSHRWRAEREMAEAARVDLATGGAGEGKLASAISRARSSAPGRSPGGYVPGGVPSPGAGFSRDDLETKRSARMLQTSALASSLSVRQQEAAAAASTPPPASAEKAGRLDSMRAALGLDRLASSLKKGSTSRKVGEGAPPPPPPPPPDFGPSPGPARAPPPPEYGAPDEEGGGVAWGRGSWRKQ